MRSTDFPRIKDVGTVTIHGTEWRLQEYYPKPSTMRNYKFITAYNIKQDLKMTFTSEETFETWLGKMQAPQQLQLL